MAKLQKFSIPLTCEPLRFEYVFEWLIRLCLYPSKTSPSYAFHLSVYIVDCLRTIWRTIGKSYCFEPFLMIWVYTLPSRFSTPNTGTLFSAPRPLFRLSAACRFFRGPPKYDRMFQDGLVFAPENFDTKNLLYSGLSQVFLPFVSHLNLLQNTPIVYSASLSLFYSSFATYSPA